MVLYYIAIAATLWYAWHYFTKKEDNHQDLRRRAEQEFSSAAWEPPLISTSYPRTSSSSSSALRSQFEPLTYPNQQQRQQVSFPLSTSPIRWRESSTQSNYQGRYQVPTLVANNSNNSRNNNSTANNTNRKKSTRQGGNTENSSPKKMAYRNERQREENEYSKMILRQYNCPFQADSRCNYVNEPSKCHFSHSTQIREAMRFDDNVAQYLNLTDAKDIPYYVCIYGLVKNCRLPTERVQRGESLKTTTAATSSSSSSRNTSNRANYGRANNNNHNNNAARNVVVEPPLVMCPTGFHCTLEDMCDLEYFQKANSHAIAKKFGNDGERQCGICLDRVLSHGMSRNRKFAILENCTHCFCAPCMESWIKAQSEQRAHIFDDLYSFELLSNNTNTKISCPLCRVVSDRYLIRKRFVENAADKQRLFSFTHRTNNNDHLQRQQQQRRSDYLRFGDVGRGGGGGRYNRGRDNDDEEIFLRLTNIMNSHY